MQRQELEKLGWTTRGLSYLEKRLQSCEDEAEGKTLTALSSSLPALFSKRCGRESCKV